MKSYGIPELLIIGVGAVSLFLGLFFSAQAGLFTLGAAWLGWAVFRKPKTAFFLLVFFIPIFPLIKVTELFAPLTLTKDIMIGALAVAVWILPVLQKRDSYRRNDLLIPLILFGAWAVVSFGMSEHLVLGALRFRDLVLYVPLLWIAREIIRTKEDIRTFSLVLFSSATLVFILAAIQIFVFPDSAVLRYDPVLEIWIPRLSSTFGHPNLFGTWLIVIVPFGIATALWKQSDNWIRIYGGAIGAIGAIAAYLTFSRGVWIALACALAVLGMSVAKRLGKHAVQVLAIGFALLILFAVSVPNVQTFLRTVVDPRYESNRERIDIVARLVADMSSAQAVVGKGLGDTVHGDTRVTLHDVAATDTQAVRVAKGRTLVDNAMLKTWVEMGVIGVVLTGWIYVRAFLLGFKRSASPISATLAAVAVGFAVLSLFLDVPEIFPAAFMFWTFVGAASHA